MNILSLQWILSGHLNGNSHSFIATGNIITIRSVILHMIVIELLLKRRQRFLLIHQWLCYLICYWLLLNKKSKHKEKFA